MRNHISNYRSVIYTTIAILAIVNILLLSGCEYEPEGEYIAPVPKPSGVESSILITPDVDSIDVFSDERWVSIKVTDLIGNISTVMVQINESTPKTYGAYPDSTFRLNLEIDELTQGYHTLHVFAELPIQTQSIGAKLIGEKWYAHYSWVLNVIHNPEIPIITYYGFKDGKPVIEWSKWKYNRFRNYKLYFYYDQLFYHIDSTSFHVKRYNGSYYRPELTTYVSQGTGFESPGIAFPSFEVPCQVSHTSDEIRFDWEVPPYYKNLAAYELQNTKTGDELFRIDNVLQTTYHFTEALFGKVYNFEFTTINKYTSKRSDEVILPPISVGEYTPIFDQFLTSSTCFCSIYKDSIRCFNTQNNTLLGKKKLDNNITKSGISFNGSNIIVIVNDDVYLINGPSLANILVAQPNLYGFLDFHHCDVNDQKIGVFHVDKEIVVYDFNNNTYSKRNLDFPESKIVINNKNWFVVSHSIYQFVNQKIYPAGTLPNYTVLDFLIGNDDYLVTLTGDKIIVIDITNLMVVNEIPFDYDKFYAFDQGTARILFSKDGYLKTISVQDGSIEEALQYYNSSSVDYKLAGNYIHSSVRTCKKYK